MDSGLVTVSCLCQPNSTIFECLKKCSTTITPEIVFYYACVADRKVNHGVCVALQVEGQIQEKANVLSIPPTAPSPAAQPAGLSYVSNHGFCPEEDLSSSY